MLSRQVSFSALKKHRSYPLLSVWVAEAWFCRFVIDQGGGSVFIGNGERILMVGVVMQHWNHGNEDPTRPRHERGRLNLFYNG